jgi:glycosyltransferase involved in cell wall biosynthesis
MRAPTVTAIVPVHNRPGPVSRAVASLAAQTLDDMEIIVVDDGSTDNSAEAAERAAPGQVRVLRHSSNRGIPAARNTGLEAAQGRYVAWLDSDDIANPRRLERQVRFLDRRVDLAMVGSAARCIGPDGQRKRGVRMPLLDHRAIAPALLFRSPFQQSTVMGRASILKQFLYREEYSVCEDLDMFIRLSVRHRVGNMHDVLVDRTIHPGQIGRREGDLVRDRKRKLLASQLADLQLAFTPDDLDRHVTLGAPKNEPQSREMMDWAQQWLERLRQANNRVGRYDPNGLALASAMTWVTLCRADMRGHHPVRAARELVGSSLTLGFLGSAGLSWISEALPTLLGSLG